MEGPPDPGGRYPLREGESITAAHLKGQHVKQGLVWKRPDNRVYSFMCQSGTFVHVHKIPQTR